MTWSNLIITILCAINVFVDARRYHSHDRIGIVANTVGPFNNPTETYPVS